MKLRSAYSFSLSSTLAALGSLGLYSLAPHAAGQDKATPAEPAGAQRSGPVASGPDIIPGPYTYGPDSTEQAGVPKGREEKLSLPVSKIFPGADHEAWLYIPAQYDPSKPACLMVFQDGGGYVKRDGAWRVPTVFDNLIHQGKMPVTIGLFINPGVVKEANADALARYNRSYEYDGLGDSYARFLLEEVIPQISQKYPLSDKADDRALCGASSGAICAFTAAWERPDAFRRVLSTIGTYVSLRGGNEYPALIRKVEPKPLRVFLQDGINDLNIYGGDWWVANLAMERSLTFAGYEVEHLWGDSAHDSKQAGPALPQMLTWLWKGHGAQAVSTHPENSKQPLAQWCDLSSDWEQVSTGHGNTEGPCTDLEGTFYFTDRPNKRIHEVAADGKVSVFAEASDGADGLALGPDGWLYATCFKSVVAFSPNGQREVIADGFAPNDLVVAKNGALYVTEFATKKIWYIPAGQGKRQARVVDEGVAKPNGVVLSPDQTLLYVADTAGQFIYSYQIQPDGSLTHKQKYFHMHLPDNAPSGTDGLCVDKEGRLYAATAAGIQICDQAGRVNAILSKPVRGHISNVEFGGPNLDYLYVTAGPSVYRRKMKTSGFHYATGPFKPAKPRL